MKQPVQARSRGSAERVLDAVLQILSTEGIAGLTTARVAEVSGVSNGSIYHRFGSRSALLAGALDRFVAQVQERARVLRQTMVVRPQTLGEAIPLLVGVYQMFFSDHGGLIRAFFVDSLNEPELVDRGELAKGLFVEQVAGFLAGYDDQITAPDREVAYWMVHRLLFGYFMLRTLFHDDPGSDAMLASLAAAVHGVLTPVQP